jgi:hypothetical protein
VHKASALGIKFGPEVVEPAQCFLGDLQALFVLSGVKTLKDNGDEQVKENERNNYHEADEERIGLRWRAASSYSISLQFFESLIIFAVKSNCPHSRTVIHNKIP